MPTPSSLNTATDAPPAWSVRAYGAMLEDLAIDPLAGPLPLAAARVLSACVDTIDQPLDPLGWPVNLRLQALLAVTIASCGSDWTWSARCPHVDCRAAMDVPLRLNDFRAGTAARQVDCAVADGRILRLAVPTGHDQIAWLEPEGSDLLPRLLVGDCVPDELTSAERDAIAEALEAADPLRTLEIETHCPECGREVKLDLDLEVACLGRLAARRPRMFDDIHRLASVYHWPEREIMAVPAERRAEYLARIEEAWA